MKIVIIMTHAEKSQLRDCAVAAQRVARLIHFLSLLYKRKDDRDRTLGKALCLCLSFF